MGRERCHHTKGVLEQLVTAELVSNSAIAIREGPNPEVGGKLQTYTKCKRMISTKKLKQERENENTL